MWAFILAAFVIGAPANCPPPVSKNKRKREDFESINTTAVDIHESDTDRVCREEIDKLFYDDAEEYCSPKASKKPRTSRASGGISGLRAEPWKIYSITDGFDLGGFASINTPTYMEPDWDAAVSRRNYMQGMGRDAVVKEVAALKYFIDIDVVDD